MPVLGIQCYNNANFNPRRSRGAVDATPPPPQGFWKIAEKTAARSAAGFLATLWGILCATFDEKISVHRSERFGGGRAREWLLYFF